MGNALYFVAFSFHAHQCLRAVLQRRTPFYHFTFWPPPRIAFAPFYALMSVLFPQMRETEHVQIARRNRQRSRHSAAAVLRCPGDHSQPTGRLPEQMAVRCTVFACSASQRSFITRDTVRYYRGQSVLSCSEVLWAAVNFYGSLCIVQHLMLLRLCRKNLLEAHHSAHA